jgi:hypothetical protein
MLSRQLQAANQIVQELVLLSSQLSSPSSSDSVEMGELEQCVLKLAQTLVQQMVNRLGAASARLWFFDPQEGCFQSVAHAGLLSPAHDQIQRIYPDDSPLGRVAQEGLPLLSNNPAQEAWMPAPEWVKANGLRGFVAYPINRGEERLGALALLSRTPLEASFLIVKHAGARRIDLIIQPKAQQDAGSSTNPQAPYTHLEVNYPTPTAKAVRSGLSVALSLLCSTREQNRPGPPGWFTAAPKSAITFAPFKSASPSHPQCPHLNDLPLR